MYFVVVVVVVRADDDCFVLLCFAFYGEKAALFYGVREGKVKKKGRKFVGRPYSVCMVYERYNEPLFFFWSS